MRLGKAAFGKDRHGFLRRQDDVQLEKRLPSSG